MALKELPNNVCVCVCVCNLFILEQDARSSR